MYSKSKVQANNYVLDAYKTKGLKASIILPSVFLGPDDPFNSPLNLAIKKFLKGHLPALINGEYNITDVRDIAKGIVLASKYGKDGESYILAGEQMKVKDLIGEVALIANKKPVKLTVPIWLVKMVSPFIVLSAKIQKKTPTFTAFSMDCLRQNSHYSFEKAAEKIGYEPRDIHDSLIATVNWMKDSGYLDR